MSPRKRILLRDIANEWTWYETVNLGDDGSILPPVPPMGTIAASAIMAILDRTPSTTHHHRVLTELVSIRKLLLDVVGHLKDAAKPDIAPELRSPGDARAEAMSESRTRAWAAYVAAGGTMPFEPFEAPDPSVDPVAKADRLDLPVSLLHFPIRIRKMCERENIKTIRDLVARTANDLIFLPSFGAVSLGIVESRLAKIGLSLAKDH